ncbi:MAG: VOC family protein [Gemmatimonadales bacterium]|nr:MAG: VOC family protein [Gemmatimonadales bacterium]
MAGIPLGRFVWYELLTSDPDAAIPFYAKLIGWTTSHWQGEMDQPYTMWMNGETPVGGVMQLPEDAVKAGAPPHWLAYVSTPDIDHTTKQAASLGGVVHHVMEIPTVGKIAILADPGGAIFAAYTPAGDMPGGEGPPERGQFSWHELLAHDHEAAFGFYSKLFGWEKTDAFDMGEAGMYQMYGLPGTGIPLGGMFTKPKEIPAPPHWLLYTMVDNVDSRADQVRQLGGQVLMGPMEVPGGDRIVQCMDKQGAVFALHSK